MLQEWTGFRLSAALAGALLKLFETAELQCQMSWLEAEVRPESPDILQGRERGYDCDILFTVAGSLSGGI